jgi:hypothetical protein
MVPPAHQDEEIRYRFSRPVRVWAGIVCFAAAIAGTVTLVVLRSWEGVGGMVIGVYGTGDLLAQQLGLNHRLARTIRHATLLWVLVSAAILALAAVRGANIVVIAVVAAGLCVWDLFSYWHRRRARQRQPADP